MTKIPSLFILLILSAYSTFGQSSLNQHFRYVDFHAHTNLKRYYRAYSSPNNRPSCTEINKLNWYDLEQSWDDDKVGDFSTVYGKPSYNQATYDLLGNSKARIICTSIYTLEKQSASQTRKIPLIGCFKISLRTVNKFAVTKIPKKKQQTFYNSPNINDLESQLAFINCQLPFIEGCSSKPIKIATEGSQLDDTNVIWLVLSIEGGHNFWGTCGNDNMLSSYYIGKECADSLIINLTRVKNNNRIFFITPAHLFWNNIVGHARGLDMDNNLARKYFAKRMWDTRFSVVDGKDGEGILDTIYKQKEKREGCQCERFDKPLYTDGVGWRFIKACLDSDNRWHKPTYIDMRHMDILARHDYIRYTDSLRTKGINIPLIVSHAAVSGKDFNKAKYLGLCPINDDFRELRNQKNFYRRIVNSTDPNGTSCGRSIGFRNYESIDSFLKISGWFLPSSNNLYNEEIKAVYESGGIIGITLEERALGKGTYNYKHNKDTLDEFTERNLRHYTSIPPTIDKKVLKIKLKQAEPFVRNLFYIVEHSECNGLDAWKHVAIGSDFDGIMNPIDICPTASDIPAFYRFLCMTLPLYADYLGKTALLANTSPDTLMNMLFYENGESFIRAHL